MGKIKVLYSSENVSRGLRKKQNGCSNNSEKICYFWKRIVPSLELLKSLAKMKSYVIVYGI